MINEVEIENLVTVKNFSKLIGISVTYVRKLEQLGEISFVLIDGVAFIDKVENREFFKQRVIKRIKNILKATK